VEKSKTANAYPSRGVGMSDWYYENDGKGFWKGAVFTYRTSKNHYLVHKKTFRRLHCDSRKHALRVKSLLSKGLSDNLHLEISEDFLFPLSIHKGFKFNNIDEYDYTYENEDIKFYVSYIPYKKHISIHVVVVGIQCSVDMLSLIDCVFGTGEEARKEICNCINNYLCIHSINL
jgi:hypothetical protein